MSGATQTAGDGAGSPAAIDGLTPEEIEASARALGWKPQNEFRGPPDKWRPADQFMATTANPAVLANNFRVLSDRYRTLESTHRSTTQQLTAKLDEATGMVGTLTDRFRTVEERAYTRARKELLAERDKAISDGDTAAVHRLDADVQELDAGKPPPKPAATTTTTTAQPTAPAIDPEVAAWSAKNDWFFKDVEMQASANAASAALRANPATAALPIGEHLAEVDKIIRRTFPDKFAAPRVVTPPAGDDDDDAAPPAVETPNAGGAGRAQGQRNRRDFNSMPRDAKAAFTKYKEIIGRKVEEGGRVKPLTEAEWARDYWAQFEEA